MKRVWHDSDNVVAQPEFLKAPTNPKWASLPESTHGKTKRPRDVDVSDLLGSTSPLIQTPYDQKYSSTPYVQSVFKLSKDVARQINWHYNSQLAVVAGSKKLYCFYSSGRFLEPLSIIDIKRPIHSIALIPDSEDCVVVPRFSTVPLIANLVSEVVTPLSICSSQKSIYQLERVDRDKSDDYIISVQAAPYRNTNKCLAIARGSSISLISSSSGSQLGRLYTPDPIRDMAFNSSFELSVALRQKVLVFDLRQTVSPVRTYSDNSLVDITAMSVFSNNNGVLSGDASTKNSYLALGTKSGAVHVYRCGAGNEITLAKTFLNLSTSIDSLSFGRAHVGDELSEKFSLGFSTKDAKAGFRLARFPEGRILPSFPLESAHHGFIQDLSFSPSLSILSVCEKYKVTNYCV